MRHAAVQSHVLRRGMNVIRAGENVGEYFDLPNRISCDRRNISEAQSMTPLDIWSDEFTPEIVALAKNRILDGGNLGSGACIHNPRSIKLALILVRLLNPLEIMSEAETSVLMGVTAPTLRKMREDKAFITVWNR